MLPDAEDEFPYAIRVVVRGPRVERLVVHGLHLRFDAGSHGRGRAYHRARFRHRHGPHQGGRRRGHPLRHPGHRGLPRRHGLQGVRHGEGHHRPADGQQGPWPVRRASSPARSSRPAKAAPSS
ncbi:MAG: hypothetical protein ACLTDR_07010 [Adlercreutzia equolifaciens]